MYFQRFLVAVSAVAVLSQPGQAATCSDLSLVLAIDGSSSIDAAEFALQVAGYAAAFADPGVQKALSATGVTDVAVVFWADADFLPRVIPWTRIQGAGDAMALSQELLSTRRAVLGSTDIGAGLMTALDLLDRPDRCTARAVINVSGDGRASAGSRRRPLVSLSAAVERARHLGVTINGLAILNEEPDLEYYYQKYVITGPGAFVMAVSGFDTFGAAIIQKLEREIGPAMSASLDSDLVR